MKNLFEMPIKEIHSLAPSHTLHEMQKNVRLKETHAGNK